MTDFTAADLRDFMTSYQGIEGKHNAVVAFWEDLLGMSGPVELDEQTMAEMQALLPKGCALSRLHGGVESPFGIITHRPMNEGELRPGFIAPEFALLEVAGRLFTVGYTDSGGYDFSGDEIQEVAPRHSRELKLVPKRDGMCVSVYPEVDFIPGVEDGQAPEAVANLAAMMSTGALSPLWNRPRAGEHAPDAVLDPEGRPVRYLGDGGLDNESGAWLEISYLQTSFLLRLDWSSYGGLCVGGNSEASQARSAMVARTEYVPVGDPVETVSFDDGPLGYLLEALGHQLPEN